MSFTTNKHLPEGATVNVILWSHNSLRLFEVRRSDVKVGMSLHSSGCRPCSIIVGKLTNSVG